MLRTAAAFLFVHIALASSAFASIPTLRVEGDDGSVALALTAMTVDVTVRGHLARTEFELTYRNELDRIVEGKFTFPLPADAEVSDVGLYFGDVLRRGVAVERVLARRAYEETIHRGVDPALVEWNAGRAFNLRVYPIPANGDKKVFIAYDQELTSSDYELDVRYAKSIPKFDLRVDAEGRESTVDGFVRVAREQFPTALAARSSEDDTWYASAAIDVPASRHDAGRAPHVVILYDTSSSSVQQNAAALRRFLESFLARQQEDAIADVIPFDIALGTAQRISNAGAPGAAFALQRVLSDLQPLGATNLHAIATELPRLVAALPPTARIVLVTDGLTSLGNSRDVHAAFAKLAALRRPLTIVNASPNVDDRLLANTASATGGWWIDLSQLDPTNAAASAMKRPIRTDLAAPITPRTIVSTSAARFAIAARSDAGALLTLHGRPLRELTDAKSASMIRRAWARAELREMLARGAADDELIEHGRRYTQLTPRTSLIVLETWMDYERYGIPMPPDVQQEKERFEREAMERTRASSIVRTSVPISRTTPGGWFLTGRVLDESGIPLPGVTVTLTDGGVRATVTITDAEGRFVLALAMPPHDPGITAELAGLRPTTRELSKAVPSGASLDLVLVVSRVSESITVTAEPTIAQPTASSISSSVPSIRSGVTTRDKLLNAIASGAAPADGENEEVREAVAKQRRNLTLAVIEKLRDIGTTAERVRYYLSARALLGGDKGFHVFAAEVFRRHSPEIAARILSDLAEARPDDAPMLRILARVLDGWGETELARMLLERAIEISPEEPQSWREMILVEARRGRETVTSWSKRMLAIKREDDAFEDVYVQTADVMRRLETNGNRRGADLRADPSDDLTIELMYDTGYSWCDLHVIEPTGEDVSWDRTTSKAGATYTGGYTFGFGPQVYTLKNAPRGKYRLSIDYYGPDDTAVSLETLVHVIVYHRGQRRDHFMVMSYEDEDRELPAVVIE